MSFLIKRLSYLAIKMHYLQNRLLTIQINASDSDALFEINVNLFHKLLCYSKMKYAY